MIGEHGAKKDRFDALITQELLDAGLKPIEFKKPLKSITTLIRLKKRIEPVDLSERHQAVGWCLGTLIGQFEKELFNVYSLIMKNTEDAVIVEAIVNIGYLTFEDNYTEWLDRIIERMAGEDRPSHGWCWSRKYWKWDSAERISDVFCLEQKIGNPTSEHSTD